MNAKLVESVSLGGFLSFAPGSKPIELGGLNVLIGANASGKTNFVEAFSVLSRLSGGDQFQNYLAHGGGVEEWIWKGNEDCDRATLDVALLRDGRRRLRYKVAFGEKDQLASFLEESFEELGGESNPAFTYFRIDGPQVQVATKYIGPAGPEPDYKVGTSDRQFFRSDQSLLSQRSNADSYPDTFWLTRQFVGLGELREWSLGRSMGARRPQQTLLPTDQMVSGGKNLALLVQEFDHHGLSPLLNRQLKRLLPRFERISTRLNGGAIVMYLHEEGFSTGVPAARLSDGTLRFIGLLVSLFAPAPPPLICIEEPELGLHPDAVSLVTELLVEASSRTQLVVTTHSDALVSALTNHVESVLVCEHRGSSQIDRLDVERLRYWLDRYRLGDLWRMGELGGNP